MTRRSLALGLSLFWLGGTVRADGHRLILADNQTLQVFLPREFSFPFGGVRYSSLVVTSNGFIGLGARSTTATGSGITRANWLQGLPNSGLGFPSIGAWTDLNPAEFRGEITAGLSGPGEYTVSYRNVPFHTAGVFHEDIVLRSDGSFAIRFGLVAGMPPAGAPRAIVGFSGGKANTTGLEPPVDLGSLPSPIGTGVEAAIYEDFGPENPFDLSGRTLEFAPVLPASGRVAMGDTDVIPLQLPGGFPFHGNVYYDVFVHSHGWLSFTSPTILAPDTRSLLTVGDAVIVPLSGDHTPASGGTISTTWSPGRFSVQWIAVPAWGTTATSTFGVTLESDGRFAMAFGPVAYPRSEPAYTGAGSGYAATSPTAGPVDLSALSQPLGANEPVLYEEWRRPVTPPANPFDLPPLVAWNAFPGPRDLSLRSDSRVQVELTTQGGAPLEFPFAGTRWRTVWLNANGSLSFESTDPEDSVLNTATTFLTRWPRIAPLQRPWDPAPLGRVRVLREAGSMTFDWHVAAYGPPAYSDFSATLFRGGAFLLRYNQIAADVSGCVAGYSVGRNRPSRMEAGVDLGSRVTPPYGEGTETAVYERFSTQTRPDLEGTVVSFPLGSLPILLLGPPRIGRTFEVAIGDGPASAGLPYAAACSLGPGPTPIPPEPRPVPLDLSSPLASISLLAFPGFLGVCDGNGQARGLRVPVPGEPALVGLPVWVSFLTLGARPPLGIEGMPEGPIAFQIAP